MPKKSKRRKPTTCPCGSGKPYDACCRLIHQGQRATTPEQLMRSRFTAFALGNVDYLWATTHPEHPLQRHHENEGKKALRNSCSTLRYQRLFIHTSNIDGQQGQVLFTAHVFERGKNRSFSELSEFERRNGQWFYRSGLISSPAEAEHVSSIMAFLDWLKTQPPIG